MFLLKIGVTYNDKLSRNVKNNGKDLKKVFLYLRCSNVSLHLEYKLPLWEPKIEVK